ncbi:MAG: FdtA/QdtA family cupin domain-containing protein [Porticoccaceae bacterium]|nr:FdtA/QdtA family cupin domain-containing protein [Porticoccaceae bacterium]
MQSNFFSELTLPIHGGGDGYLVALEEMSDLVPFEIKRVYYIFSVQETLRRGFHAHKSLKQLLICLSGQCDLLLDNGMSKATIHIDSPEKGILIEQPLWREMFNFSSDCVLLVVASDHYDENDYVRDYAEFKKLVGKINV